jgi:hypothetical protein
MLGDVSPFLANLQASTPYDAQAWSSYLATGDGPPNGAVASPEGDIVTFGADGTPEATYPHAGSGTDADVIKDPASEFYGWTQAQLNAYGAAQGVQVATDAVRAAAAANGGVVTPAALAASQAQLIAQSQSDPVVAAALNTLATSATGYGSNTAAVDATNDALNAAELESEAQQLANSLQAEGGEFLDDLPPGEIVSNEAALETKAQFIADYIAQVQAGGPRGVSIADAVSAGILTTQQGNAAQTGALPLTPSGGVLTAAETPPLVLSPTLTTTATLALAPSTPPPAPIASPTSLEPDDIDGDDVTPLMLAPAAASTGLQPATIGLIAAAGLGVFFLMRKR